MTGPFLSRHCVPNFSDQRMTSSDVTWIILSGCTIIAEFIDISIRCKYEVNRIILVKQIIIQKLIQSVSNCPFNS